MGAPSLDSAVSAPSAPKQGGWGGIGGATEGAPSIQAIDVQPEANEIEYMDSIPTLDDDNDTEDLTFQVAEPTKVTASQNRMISLGELNHSKAFVLPKSSDIGMDLSILMSGLALQNQIVEQDEAWDMEGLLREIQDELQVEKDKQDDVALP